MYRVHELEDVAQKKLGGGQSASAEPKTAAAKGSGETQPTPKAPPKPETDEFKDPDKNIDVCCTGCSICTCDCH